MDNEIRFVFCPECGHEQADMGRHVECEECGYHPMPWYDEHGDLNE